MGRLTACRQVPRRSSTDSIETHADRPESADSAGSGRRWRIRQLLPSHHEQTTQQRHPLELSVIRTATSAGRRTVRFGRYDEALFAIRRNQPLPGRAGSAGSLCPTPPAIAGTKPAEARGTLEQAKVAEADSTGRSFTRTPVTREEWTDFLAWLGTL